MPDLFNIEHLGSQYRSNTQTHTDIPDVMWTVTILSHQYLILLAVAWRGFLSLLKLKHQPELQHLMDDAELDLGFHSSSFGDCVCLCFCLREGSGDVITLVLTEGHQVFTTVYWTQRASNIQLRPKGKSRWAQFWFLKPTMLPEDHLRTEPCLSNRFLHHLFLIIRFYLIQKVSC